MTVPGYNFDMADFAVTVAANEEKNEDQGNGFFTLSGVQAHEKNHLEFAISTFKKSETRKSFMEMFEVLNSPENGRGNKKNAENKFSNNWAEFHNKYLLEWEKNGGEGVKLSKDKEDRGGGELFAQQAEWNTYVSEYEKQSEGGGR
jgi:hypothetical protein